MDNVALKRNTQMSSVVNAICESQICHFIYKPYQNKQTNMCSLNGNFIKSPSVSEGRRQNMNWWGMNGRFGSSRSAAPQLTVALPSIYHEKGRWKTTACWEIPKGKEGQRVEPAAWNGHMAVQ